MKPLDKSSKCPAQSEINLGSPRLAAGPHRLNRWLRPPFFRPCLCRSRRTLPSTVRAGTDRADMCKPARGERGNTTPSVPRLAHNMRWTGPHGLGRSYRRAIGNSSRSASSMKVEKLNVNRGPICQVGRGRMFPERTIVRQPNAAIELATGSQNQ